LIKDLMLGVVEEPYFSLGTAMLTGSRV